MLQNIHLLLSEQNAIQVSRYVRDYSTNVLDLPLAEHPSPSDVSIAVSDLVTDLTHYASIYGVASEVLAKAFQNYLEEISTSDVSKVIVDRFKAFIDDAIYEATIGTNSKP